MATNQVVPLPPLAEQHRIVAKVDELMALCDELEAARTEREAQRDRLTAASLHRIGTAAVTTLPAAARFHLDHLPRLTTRVEHIKQLRQTILNLAVRGRLVPQVPNDEPSAELLKVAGEGASEDAVFSIPNSWRWVTVGQTSVARLGKMLDKAKNKGTFRRYLRNINVRWFDFDLSDVYEMPFEDKELEEFALLRGDVLVCEGGEPGRAAVWDEREKDIYFQKAIHRVRFTQGVDSDFFVNVLRESADSGRLASYFTGVGIKHFTGKGLASFAYPLPPLAEQHRIVAKVDELMALCDQLEAQITSTETDSRRLLEAVLRDALSPVA
jgi:type I restriction enzyme S subunit